MDQRTLSTHFGKAVRALRSERGFSQEGFADAVSVHRTTMGMIERGKAVVSIFTAYRIAVALEISLADLFEKVTAQSD